MAGMRLVSPKAMRGIFARCCVETGSNAHSGDYKEEHHIARKHERQHRNLLLEAALQVTILDS